MQFDVLVMNPPYQPPVKIAEKDGKYRGSGARGTLWPAFVKKPLSLCKDNGYCAHVHPPKWRKPEDELWPVLSQKKMKHLEIHNAEEGVKIFGAATRYDWYVLQNSKNDTSFNQTIVIDEQGTKHEFSLSKLPFLPNFNFEAFKDIIAQNKEDALEIIFHFFHDTRQPYMSKERNDEFKYPCVHSMRKDGKISFYYSNKKSDMFVPKVIVNGGGYPYPIVDMAGEYGMCQDVFGIKVDSLEYANLIKKAIETEPFQEVVKATKWSTFRIDHRMFKSLRKDFWKAFVDANGNEI
jgi:hypothetical protein